MRRRDLLRISADVHLFLSRGEPARLYDWARDGYTCPVCLLQGRLSANEPAAVLLDLYADDLTRQLALIAHAACTPSRVRLVDPEPDDQPPGWPAMVWQRPRPADPPGVLLIGPATTRTETTPTGEVIDLLTDGLLHDGYTLLLDPLTTLPHIAGLTIVLGPGRQLEVTTAHDVTVWAGSLAQPAGWLHAARTADRVGIVVAIGIHLDNPYRDHLDDLDRAMRDGAVVGATALIREQPEDGKALL